MSQETRPGDRPAVGGRGFSQIPMLPELAAVASAFLVGALILWVTGHPVLDTFYHLLQGAFGSWTALGTTLTRATPLIFTGLAFAVAFKCGLFNIGAEGQLHVGALAPCCAQGEAGGTRSGNDDDAGSCGDFIHPLPRLWATQSARLDTAYRADRPYR